MASIRYGPNEILTEEEVKERKGALQKLSDDQIKRCEKLLLEGGESLTALAVGESGSGKSTLINALLGEEIAEVSSGPTQVTKEPKRYSGYIEKVEITVVEVPDLDINDIRRYRHSLGRYCPNGVDVVYVCQKLYDRHRPSAIKTLRRLSVAFGKEIYKKAVIVMTFANEVPKSWGHKIDKETFRKKLEKDWHDQAAAIRATLQKELHMMQEEAEKTLVLPAGYHDKDDPENSSRQILNVTSDWIHDLMLASVNTNIAASRESSDSSNRVAAPAFLRVMASQVREDFGGSSGGAYRRGGGSYSSSDDSDSSSSPYSSSDDSDSSSSPYSSSDDSDSSSSTYSSSGSPYSSSGGDECQLSGYVSKFLGGIARCLEGLASSTFKKVASMVQNVISAIFSGVAAVCEGVGKLLKAIYDTGARIVEAAVVASLVCAVSTLVIAAVVIVILTVILTILLAIAMGFIILMGVAVGAVVGAGIGAAVGSIFPGVGTAAGAAVGSVIGGTVGTGAVGLIGLVV